MAELVYDRGERRSKHRWNQERAGFQEYGSHLIGKCDGRITDQVATRLLKDAVPWYDDDESNLPSHLYNIFGGAVYEARLTPGPNTYHGYPWRQRAPGKRLPSRVKRLLLERAEQQGCEPEIKRWIEKHSN